MTGALLLGLLAFLANHDYALGTSLISKPIVTGPFVGLIMGDLTQGIIIGGVLELVFIGAQSIGAFIPPDVIVGGILGTAFAIETGQGAAAAVALSYPIALLSTMIKNVEYVTIKPLMANLADKYAAEGKEKAVERIHIGLGLIGSTMRGLIVFLGFELGSSYIGNIVEAIPSFINDGLTIATGLLPAMGFAMLLQMTIQKKSTPFFLLSIILSAYLGLPVLGTALLGVVVVLIMYVFNSLGSNTQTEGTDDNEF